MGQRGQRPVQDTERQALTTALRLLARRDYFHQELQQRLLGRGFSAAFVETALARCCELGYLDDQATTERFIELRATDRGWGPHRLVAELTRRGVPAELAEQAVQDRDDLTAQALAVALAKAERRAPAGWWQQRTGQAKLVRQLLRLGFNAEQALEAVNRLVGQRRSEQAEEPA